MKQQQTISEAAQAGVHEGRTAVSEAAGSTALPEIGITSSAVVAIYDTHAGAESAVKTLEHEGYDMTKLSIVGRDYHTDEHVVGYYNVGDRMKAWGKLGAFWGGLWGLLFGAAVFFFPGVGPVLVAGPLVAWIVAGLEGAVVVGGLGALGGALVSIGVPKDSALKYETEVQAGRFLLIAHGTKEETDRARAILELTHHSGITAHTAD
jgi:uncharacterized membrane protein